MLIYDSKRIKKTGAVAQLVKRSFLMQGFRGSNLVIGTVICYQGRKYYAIIAVADIEDWLIIP